jgi:hypothetical protein
MAKTIRRKAKSEPLNFPNPSRSYDGTRHGVCFWGYDQTLEISFVVEEAALSKVSPETRADKAGFLDAFDLHRERILAVAGRIYSGRHKASYTLTDSDF